MRLGCFFVFGLFALELFLLGSWTDFCPRGCLLNLESQTGVKIRGPDYIDPQTVGFPYSKGPKKVPLISENPRWGTGIPSLQASSAQKKKSGYCMDSGFRIWGLSFGV